MKDKMLHIYGQDAHHDDVQIVGNRAGLEALRDMIGQALDNGNAGGDRYHFWVGDGEGYAILISLYDRTWADWGQVAVPYAGTDWAEEHREGALWPAKIWDYNEEMSKNK